MTSTVNGPPHHLDAPASWQVHVEQDDVGLLGGDRGHRLVDVRGLGDHVDHSGPGGRELGAHTCAFTTPARRSTSRRVASPTTTVSPALFASWMAAELGSTTTIFSFGCPLLINVSMALRPLVP